MNKTIEVLKNHNTVRKFSDRQVEDDVLREIVRCAQCAATSEFIQSYTIIHIKNEMVKKEIYETVTKQQPILDAPVFLMFCADVRRLGMACEMNGKNLPEMYSNYTETFLMTTVDTAIAAQNALAAAESLGMGGTYMGGIRNNPEKVCQLLKLPKGVYPVFGMVLGYPAEPGAPKERLPLDVVLKTDTYTTEGDEEKMREYDARIKEYYIRRTDGKRTETWTEQMTDFVNEPQRPFMREFLEKQGFSIE